MKMKNKPVAVAGMIAAVWMMCLSSYGFTLSMDAVDNSIADGGGVVYDSQEEIRGKSGSRVSYIRYNLDAAGGPIAGIAAGDIQAASVDLYITKHGDSELMEIYLLEDGAQYTTNTLMETTWTGGTDGTEFGGNNLTISNAPHGSFLGQDDDLLTLEDDVAQNATTNLIKLIGTHSFPGNPTDDVDDDNTLVDQVVQFPITDMETFRAAVSNDTNGEITFIVLTRNFIDARDFRAASLFNTDAFTIPALTVSDEADTTDPVAPSNVVLATERDVVGLDWDTLVLDPTVRGYRVYRSATSGSGYVQQAELDQSDSVFTDTNIVYGATNFYVVTSFDAAGNESTNSIEITAVPFLDVTAPAAPNVSAVEGDGLITLSWTDNGETDIAGYNVFRSETSGSYGAALTNTTGQTYVDTNVVNGTTYYYKVTAVDDSLSENESGYVEVSAVPDVFTGDSTVFGSDHDGLDGFIQSTFQDATQSWTIETNSVRYFYDESGTENFSLLKSFPLDRSPGKSYKLTA
ncbi:MAG TPA: hypothetical protein VJ904_04170, partial [Tichowtungia sp.]|nr:hypothetical protein [Tichowtungia sp.]